ncbi:hypothetical protein D018_5125B, partial [Vibrio parahaemolyticus VP2007-007]
PLHKQ